MTEPARPRSTRARAALACLPEVDPGLAALALWCDLQDGTDDETYTSGDIIHVGGTFETLPLQEQISVLGHHVLHVALRHEVDMTGAAARFSPAYDPQLYALCLDAVVNECLLRGGHALPRPSALLSEVIARALPEAQTDAADMIAHWTPERLYRHLADDTAPRSEALSAYIDSLGCAPDIRPDGPDPTRDAKSADWQAQLIRAEHAGGSAGRGVGQVLRQIHQSAMGRTPWEVHLRRLLAKAVYPDPRLSYRRPRAGWIAREAEAVRTGKPRPAFEPALQRIGHRPRIVVAVDTSGSISSTTLALFASEINGITRKTNAETHILCFDEEVYAHHEASPLTLPNIFESITFRRGGGTSFAGVLHRADALSPSVIVMLTDGEGHFGPAPSERVIWASPRPLRTAPPFGDCVELVR